MSSDPERQAERLRSWRGDRTQREIVRDTGELTTPQSVSEYENGKIPRSWAFLTGLAEDGCDLNWLLTGRPARRNGK